MLVIATVFESSAPITSKGEQSPKIPPSISDADQAQLDQINGVWKFSSAGFWADTRVELRKDGHYEWWAPYLNSDLSVNTLIQTGKWSLHERTLTFHIEKAFLGRVSPPAGTELSFDLKLVSSEKVLLLSPWENRDMTWMRVSPQDEPFWKGAISYTPPFEMHSHLNRTNSAPFPGDWEVIAIGDKAGINRDAKVVFHLGTVAEVIQPENLPKPILRVADLKDFMDSHLKTAPDGSNVLTSISRIDGRDALMGVSTVPQKGEYASGWQWQCAISFFWQTNAVWQKSVLCSITLTAQSKETLDLLKDSLQSVKVLSERR